MLLSTKLSPEQMEFIHPIKKLPEADMAVPIRMADIKSGGKWPPDRCRQRMDRMLRQYEASTGKMDYFLTFYDQATHQYNRIGAQFDEVNTLMMTTEPGNDLDLSLRLVLQAALEKALYNLLRHGRCVLVGYDGSIEAWDIRNTWPLEHEASAGWTQVSLRITSQSKDGSPDVIVFKTWDRETETVAGSVFRYRNGNIGDFMGTTDRVTDVRLEHVDRGPVEQHWGTPMGDALIPLAAEYVRRDSSLSSAVEDIEDPTTYLTPGRIDTNVILDFLTAQGGDFRNALLRDLENPSQSDLDYAWRVLNRKKFVIIPKGYGSIDKLTHPHGDLAASFSNYSRLDSMWTQLTGSAPSESADSGNVESGMALARRKSGLTARTATLHTPLYVASQIVLGQEYDWEYIGKRVNQAMTDDNMDDAATPRAEPLGAGPPAVRDQ